MNAKQKRIHLRQELASGSVCRLVGAHNAWGARLVQEAGFDGVWASGLEISTAHGVRDESILSMSEMLHDAYTMDKAVALPVVADCDSGFGGKQNLLHLVDEYERHGIAGVCIEDQLFPKRNSLMEGSHQLADAEEFADRLAAAKARQRSPEFLVLARIEAFIAGAGLAEALRRAALYEAACADALVVHSKRKDESEIASFMQAWRGKLPIIVIPTTYPNVTSGELKQLGIGGVIYANHGLRAAVASVRRVLAALNKLGSTQSVEGDIATLSEVFQLQQEERWASNLGSKEGQEFLTSIAAAQEEVTLDGAQVANT